MSRPALEISDRQRPKVSVVVPVFHNEHSLEGLYQRLLTTLDAAVSPAGWDVTFVDDGSKDESWAKLSSMRACYGNIGIVRLSRNFGSQAAIQAGLQRARGHCVVVIAADLQDPPEVIADMIDRWLCGAKVVVAQRSARADPLLTRVLAWMFYRVFRACVSRDMPPGGFDCFLLDECVNRHVVASKEKNTSLAALVLWMGFEREYISYERASRAHGVSMWTFRKKIKHMYDSLLPFSYVPLRAMSVAGGVAVFASLVYGGVVVARWFTQGRTAEGWQWLIVLNLLLDGVTLLSVGTLGEYLWRCFDATRSRPAFIEAEVRDAPRDADSRRASA